MSKIKVVLLLVRQLRHGFTKTANVSPNLTDAHIGSIITLVVYDIAPWPLMRAMCLFSIKRGKDTGAHIKYGMCLQSSHSRPQRTELHLLGPCPITPKIHTFDWTCEVGSPHRGTRVT